MIKLSFFLIVVTMICEGCSVMVNLTVKNDMDSPRAAKIEVKDEDGVNTQEISLGDIASKGQTLATLTMSKDNSFSVIADVSNVAVFESAPVTVTGKPNPLNKTIEIVDQCRDLDDSKSMTTLSESFKRLGDNIGGNPLTLQNALDTKIGAIVVAMPGDSGKVGKILLTAVTASQLGVRVMTLADVQYQSTNESNNVDISGKSTSDVSANVGPLAAFGVTFDLNSVYHLAWSMKGFGEVDKPEDEQKLPIIQFAELDTAVITTIKNTLDRNPGSKIFYINAFYLMQDAELSIQKATTVNTSLKVNASNIVSGNSVYTFDNQQSTQNSYGPSVLNYWGQELYLLPTKSGAPVKNLAEFFSIPKVNTTQNGKSGKGQKCEYSIQFTGKRMILGSR